MRCYLKLTWSSISKRKTTHVLKFWEIDKRNLFYITRVNHIYWGYTCWETEGILETIIDQKVSELQNSARNYRPTYAQYRWNYGIKFYERRAKDIARTIVTENVRELLTWYRHQLSELVLPISLLKGICHCDFHFSNVLFKKSFLRIVGLRWC